MRIAISWGAGVLLVLATWGQAGAGAEDPSFTAPKEPSLLFYASFEETIDQADFSVGDPSFVPRIYDRSPLLKEQGLQDWQRSKDYKAYRAQKGAEGRRGSCLDVTLGKGHEFRAAGNLSVRRGTVAFWVRFGHALPTAHAPIFSATGAAISARVRSKTVQINVGGNGISLSDVQWAPNRWYHLAIVYDCCRGVKVYVDGKLSNRSRWGKPEYGWETDASFADLMLLSTDMYTGATMPLMMDELQIYSVPLAPEGIARLASGERLSESPRSEPPLDTKTFEAHRMGELGWNVPGDPLSVKMNADKPVVIRKVGVETSRDVRMWRTGAVDGIPSTRWPSDYQGYEIPKKGLHLELEKNSQIDYLAIRGNFVGRVYSGLSIEEPPAEKALLDLKSEGKFIRKRLDKPIRSDSLSFFRVEPKTSDKMDELGRTFTQGERYIYELDMFHVTNDMGALRSAEATPFYLSTRPYTPDVKWVRWALQSHYELEDRITIEMARGRPSAANLLRLAALRHVHLFIPPQGREVTMAALRLILQAQQMKNPMRLRVQVHDPVDITRDMLNLTLTLEPPASPMNEEARTDLILDTQDFVVPPDQPLWITLTPERDFVLAQEASRIEILTLPKDEVLKEHVRNMLNYARDRFIHVSEPRPWGHVPMEHLAERALPFRQLHFALLDLKRHVPNNDKLFGLWVWTHPKENPDLGNIPEPPSHGAPKWAVYAKEAMKKYRAFALWWIENRQLPNGLFGSNYGDDTDLINDWLSLGMICDPDGRIRDSARRIADYCWLEGPILRGINRRHTDTLHAYEEGVNAQPIVAALYYGNPVYLERLMETSRTVRDELTYLLPDGRRFFKSCWYGATHIDTEYQRGRDILGNALMLHPTLYLAYYARYEGAMKLLQEWAGTWAGLQAEAFKKHGLKGPYPISAQYPTGEICATTEQYISGYGYQDTCLGMYVLTGDERYIVPIRTWIDHGVWSNPTATDWIPLLDMKPYRAKIIEAAENVNWTPLDPQMGDDPRCTLSYAAWLVSGKREYVERALESSWKRITILFPMHTWAEQSADRVAVSKTLVDRLYLGGTPGFRNKYWPTHTVSWENFTEDFAAWVLETRPTRLRVWIYNFEPKPQKGNLRVWGLDNGEYEIRLGPDANQDEKIERPTLEKVMMLARNAPLPLELPSRQLMLLEIAQRRPGETFFPRPDLAVTTTDMRYDPAKDELTFVVHNVGSRAATNVAVVVKADGKLMATHVIPLLEAPNDLVPRVVKFTQSGLRSSRRITVEVDPENRIPEIWEENNIATYTLPR